MGRNAETDLGVPGTLDKGGAPEPANSLRALVDRQLRAKVVAANEASAKARTARVTGRGHAYWVDGVGGFSQADQQALVAYLLSVDHAYGECCDTLTGRAMRRNATPRRRLVH